MTDFNLVDQAWIPCYISGGLSPVTLGLREVLSRAPAIREIRDDSPLVTVSLHRLLLAIIHRNFGPANLAEWQAIWQRGHWDTSTLDAYFDRWLSRFDLFDLERPFYQVPRMAAAESHPSQRLALGLAAGHNPTLFDHNVDSAPIALEPAEAARYLIATQAFAIGFGKSNPFYLQDAALVRGMTVLALGNNLFETLTLNLVAYNDSQPLPRSSGDVPTWEQDKPADPDAAGTFPQGYLDYLTWQSRRIHLVRDGEPTRVRYCQVQQNLKLAGAATVFFDPFKCYRADKQSGFSPVGLRPERALWRDSYVLFQRSDPSKRGPEVFEWLARIDGLRLAGRINAEPAYRFAAFGFATEAGRAASVNLWRHERLPLPLAYLRDEDLLHALEEAINLADGVGKALRQSAWRLATFLVDPDFDPKKAKQPRKETVQPIADGLSPDRAYWPTLEGPFRDLLSRLPDDRVSSGDEVTYGANELARWAATVRRNGTASFKSMANGLDGSARALKAAACAERLFRYLLGSVLKAYPTGTSEVTP